MEFLSFFTAHPNRKCGNISICNHFRYSNWMAWSFRGKYINWNALLLIEEHYPIWYFNFNFNISCGWVVHNYYKSICLLFCSIYRWLKTQREIKQSKQRRKRKIKYRIFPIHKTILFFLCIIRTTNIQRKRIHCKRHQMHGRDFHCVNKRIG